MGENFLSLWPGGVARRKELAKDKNLGGHLSTALGNRNENVWECSKKLACARMIRQNGGFAGVRWGLLGFTIWRLSPDALDKRVGLTAC